MKRSMGHPDCTLLIGGRRVSATTHAVVVPDRATIQERHAARGLASHLRRLTGEQLPVLREDRAASRRAIYVGRVAALARLAPDVDLASLGEEGIHIRTAGTRLFLAGGNRGCGYAVYTFLEEFLGVRWFAPDCTVFPEGRTFALHAVDHRYVPPFEYREPFAFCGFDADWAARNKSNGHAARLDAPRGGKIIYEGFVHTFYALVPPAKHFAAHPEYYSEIGGRRIHDHAQLCLTNPDLIEVVVEAVRERLRRNPAATIVSISQNDWHGNCQCAACRAMDAEEGSPAGALIRFVNAVAARLEPAFPGVAFDTLAYLYTRRPPKKARPRPSVIVRLCSIECSFAQPLGTGAQNRSFRKDIEGWGRICRRLYVWDYVTDFAHYLQPHPNLRVLQPNLRFFARNGVRGVFEQGGFQSPGGEFQELRTWLLAKLLWNPQAPFAALLRTFLDGYYGAAAPYLKRYIDRLHTAVARAGTFLGCYSPPTASFLSPVLLNRAERLFDTAEQAVRADPVHLERVRRARLPLHYVRIAQGAEAFLEREDTLIPASGDLSDRVERFESIARAAGVTHVREGAPNLEKRLAFWRRQAAALPIVRLANHEIEADILPALGGRLWRLRHRSTDKSWIAPAQADGHVRPAEDGYEEYTEMGYRSPGWHEDYAILARTSRSLVLEARCGNGLRLTRRLAVDARRPLIRIGSTLTNDSPKPRNACLRVHPTLAVRDFDSARLRLRLAKGGWREIPLALPLDGPGRQALSFVGRDRPAGEWMLGDGESGLWLRNCFTRANVDVCHVNWDASHAGRVQLELWSPRVLLKPGASLRITHTYWCGVAPTTDRPSGRHTAR